MLMHKPDGQKDGWRLREWR